MEKVQLLILLLLCLLSLSYFSSHQRSMHWCGSLRVKVTLEIWRHWLEGSGVSFIIWTDDKNLECLRSVKRLNYKHRHYFQLF